MSEKNGHHQNLTSSQKAVLALEVEERLAKDARTRKLAGLKQNKSLRNEFRNDSETPLRSHHRNDDETPSRNGSIRGEAAEQAAALVGTNRKYVDAAKRIRRQAPELLKTVLAGLITIPQAKKIAGMPGVEAVAGFDWRGVGEAAGCCTIGQRREQEHGFYIIT